MIAGECRVCGCTEDQACFVLDGKRLSDEELEDLEREDLFEGVLCSWIEPDLCSACVVEAAPPLLVDAQGKPLRGAP